jgi:regulator of protease activity HflC (stomatin/prohibitin superfamily)
MQALIDFIIRNLLAVWPITRVNEWQVGMIARAGRIHRELGPGLHWRWPFVEIAYQWPGVEVGLDLETAAITTMDGHSIAISANIGYRLVSIRDSYRGLWGMENTLKKVAIGVIATECARMEWPRLRSERVIVEAELLATLNERIAAWGLRIERLHLTDLVAAKPHRHYMDGALSAAK